MIVFSPFPARTSEGFDLVSRVIDSPQFKGKDPIYRLRLAAQLLRANKLKQSDMAFSLLDWGDQYVREPADPFDRLKRWAELNQDKTLSQLKIPRDLLNRSVLAEYLVKTDSYSKAPPQKRLELLRDLEDKNLVDWSVALAYVRLYAGAIISGASTYENRPPLAALKVLKKLQDDKLVGWHYRVPTEGVLIAEALALDTEYQKATPFDSLAKLREMHGQGLISALTKKELERLPAWRLLVGDPSFIKASPNSRDERLTKLKDDGLISANTSAELKAIFCPVSPALPVETSPAPVPERMAPADN